MKVKELIKRLKEYDPEAIVLVSSDEEGNSYSELSEGMSECNFDIDERDITPYYSEWSASDCGMDEEEYSEMRKLPKGLVIGP